MDSSAPVAPEQKTITASLVVQENRRTNEINVTFTTDPLTTLDDILVTGGSWRPAFYRQYDVQITGTQEAIDHLGCHEFRAPLGIEEAEVDNLSQPRLFSLDSEDGA